MAKTCINHETGAVEIIGEVDDIGLAEAAIRAGYHNAFNQGVYDVINEIQSTLPDGFRVVESRNTPPENSIRVGQVRVRTGDPEYPLYIVRKAQRGRPPISDEKMIQTAIWLPAEMIDWLKTQSGNMSETMRELIRQAMEK